MVANKPLIVIVGPTARGKTALAIEIARQFDGEIIAADSRTVYRGLDIGTAKPTKAEQSAIPHHLLDVVEPDERFTAADFKVRAKAAIEDIKRGNKLPIMVGGSGLYIDAVLYDYDFAPADAERSRTNPRHLNETIVVGKKELRPDAIVIGLEPAKDILRQRIAERAEQMVNAGFVDEVRRIRQLHPDSKALDAPGYKAIGKYLDGEISLDEAKALFIKNDTRLAKRQRTWFKRNKSIQWFSDRGSAVDFVTTKLNK